MPGLGDPDDADVYGFDGSAFRDRFEPGRRAPRGAPTWTG